MTHVLILADVSNIYYSLRKKYPNRRINYEKYMEAVTENKDLFKAIAYCGEVQNKANDFFTILRNIGFEVKSKAPYTFQVQHPSGDAKTIKRLSWTARMTIDAMIYTQRIEELVIGSNNDELVDLIRYVKDRGVYVTVYASNIGESLKQVADNTIEIPETMLYETNTQRNETVQNPEAAE